MRVLVTGATGFVGRGLVPMLADASHVARAAVRNDTSAIEAPERAVVGDIGENTDWSSALGGVDAVVHLAARVHVMQERAADPTAEFRRVNVQGTMRLAEQAAMAGVRRFVYVSSVKASGEEGTFRESDPPAPRDPYGVSKAEAEQGLLSLAARTGLEVVVIRPPLVYGPGVKGNFARLVQAIERGIPLPLGAVENARSMVALGNLNDLILRTLHHPAAANEIFFVSDGEDLSTAGLIRRLAAAMGRRPHLIPIPAGLITLAAAALGRSAAASRLLGTLRVDISKARERLAWSPPLSVDEGLRRAVHRT